MTKLKKYLKPFTGLLIMCVILLFIQAMSDLNLPNFMSDIINVGKNDGNRETTDDEAIQTLKSYLKVNDKNYEIFMKSKSVEILFLKICSNFS